jgi:hypothetical protein
MNDQNQMEKSILKGFQYPRKSKKADSLNPNQCFSVVTLSRKTSPHPYTLIRLIVVRKKPLNISWKKLIMANDYR